MLYLADKKAKLFKGDRRPVSLYLGDKKVAGYEYAEQTGEYLTFENTYNDTASVVINGKSEQTQSVWATNLIENGDFNSGMSGWSYYKNPPQIISGRAYFERELSGEENIVSLAKHEVRTIVNHKYYYSLELEQVKQGNSTYGLLNNNGFPLYLFNFKNYNPGNHKLSDIFTIEQSGYFYINCAPESEFYIDNIIVIDLTETFGAGQEPSKEECDILFADYFEGKSRVSVDVETYAPNSPSPEYPSPILSVGDDGGFDLVSAGKNLFDKSKITISAHVLYNGVVVNWGDSDWAISDYLPILPNSTYKWSGRPNSSSQAETAFYTKDKVYISKVNGIGISFTTPPTAYYYRCNTAVVDLDTAQLELGSTATPYTPFRGMTTIHIPHTLRSLPDGTKDYIEINHKDRTAKFVKNIDTVALDWNKSWLKHTGGDLWLGNMVAFNNYSDYNYIFRKSPYPQCTHFELLPDTTYYYYSENVGFVGGSWIGFKFFASDLGITSETSPEAAVTIFKSWLEHQSLAGNPVIMQYALTDPVITELDYEAVKTYYPYTQIYTASSGISPDLDGTVRVVR